ncbi:MAG TPA: shikimate dehydrogenase [Bacteroides sp.]|nr:shikimate dehydrogenase [Bacteroides sp.]
MNTRIFGLIGYPLEHSFSVSHFSRKFATEHTDAVYRNYPLKDVAEFPSLVQSEPGLHGLNVTVPYKEKIIPYLDALSQTARSIGAVNTICFCRRSGGLALTGHNTDVTGFGRSLREHLRDHHKRALVLGTGGSSKAVVHVLEKLGIAFLRVSRSRGEERVTYEELTAGMMKDHTLVINTTPLGMYPDLESCPPIPYETITADHLLFDLVYNPSKSRFLLQGEQQGASIVNGYDMLVYQAEASWEIWNRRPEDLNENPPEKSEQ